MSDVCVRRMTIEDVDAVCALEAAAFAMPWTKDMFEREMRENRLARYLVLLLAGRVEGFAGAHIILDEGHITNVAVSESLRGLGYGRQLMQALMQYVANLGVRYMTLEVRPSNSAAILLYKSLGFIKISVRKGYYEDNGEDAWLMVCDRMPQASEDFSEKETLLED